VRAWRHLLLAAMIAGLLVSPLLQAPRGWPLACLAAAALALLAARPRVRRGDAPVIGLATLLVALPLAAVAGLGLGDARLAALERRAALGPPGAEVRTRGWVLVPPRRSRGEVRLEVGTDAGRLLAVAREPVPDLSPGTLVALRGRLAAPEPWREADLRRRGIARELRARSLRVLPARRGGLAGILDAARGRAERALTAGLDGEQANLARGFVLGQDDRIDPPTREHFRRSGLAHLLAVSGQNVMLLAILAGALFALCGAGLRLRLLLTLALVALYVPIAGAGPSIQRAGVMGAAGIAATLLGRPSDRAYLLLLAAVATLLLNPLAAGDVGWQLSFAAVIGIALAAAPLAAWLADRMPARLPRRLRRPLAEGAALTVSATLATAPLMAHHFDSFSLAALPANLLALPVVAPLMWLGMLAGLLGQLGWVPTAPLGALNGPLLDWVALVAERLAAPSWALLELAAPPPPLLAAIYLGLLVAATGALSAASRRLGLRLAAGFRAALATVTLVSLLVLVLAPSERGGGRPGAPPPGTMRVTALDVGQGDAILLETAAAPPLLVDGGPPGGAALAALRERGIDRLEAAFLTHDQSDHAGGLHDVLAALPVRRLFLARPAPVLAAQARAAGTRVARLAEGSAPRFGALSIRTLWPPRERPPLADPNAESLVLLASLGEWDVLLTGDAEQEATRLDPGPIDVLKLAHHGSADAGLPSLLDRSAPRVALVGVGDDNRYGHPAAPTLAALVERGVCVLRTDLGGDVHAELGPAGLHAGAERGSQSGCG
jgi:competence protein ComEC